MKFNWIKTCAYGLGLSMAFVLSSTQAASTENIEVTQQQITQEELAAIYVLSDICPKLVGDNPQFKQGMAALAAEHLPQEKDPVAALKQLSQTAQFEKVLKEAQNDAQVAGDTENKQICEEIMTYDRKN